MTTTDCPRCPNGSPARGTFTQTFNSVRHRSQACAVHANRYAETLNDLRATRDDLERVEAEVFEREAEVLEREKQQRNDAEQRTAEASSPDSDDDAEPLNHTIEKEDRDDRNTRSTLPRGRYQGP